MSAPLFRFIREVRPLFDLLFDLIEFVAIVVDGPFGVKASNDVPAVGGGGDFTFVDDLVIFVESEHGNLLDFLGGNNQGILPCPPTSRPPISSD